MFFKFNIGFIILFVAGTSVLAQSGPVSFTCTGGTTGDCGAFIQTFCKNAALATVPPLTSIGSCFNGNGFRCDFNAFNTLTSSNSPDRTDCQAVLNIVNDDCTRAASLSTGGTGNVVGGQFHFTGDPNGGQRGAGFQCPS
ncbi:hypothetical protein GALMADRAFT_151413 [Galerina marginata CBS 339.88]|uniref:Glycan binding protein Y3-like domain-containing protein n=1 Tax=Galerina marginata (strain CBS 339.88) TaxID=685588 RepID=A0A067TMY9_GALM3|nr:hypothetical protein GALMADRAFT_151413 [Galerina marginata CBS 339.88]